MLNRRQFVGTLAAGAVLSAQSKPTRYPLGLQLFTLTGRDGLMSWERYTKAIDTAKSIGFDSLELAGLWGFKAEAIRKYAEGKGLKIRSLHMGFDQMIQFMAPGETAVVNAQDAMYTPQSIPQLARINAPVARDLGAEWGVLASSGISNFKTIDSVKRLCDSFNLANEATKQVGLKFAYHMHAIDFEPVQGKMPFEMMLDLTDPSMRYQLDVCWAQDGGASPAGLVDKYASKIVSFHLKDLDKEKKIATPGDGVVDFAALHKAAQKIQDPIFFVERDGLNGRDPVVEATRAYKYLQGLGWGKV